ncbi:MAG: 23S rRNA (adenine(2503)-C(2))-methyltransferase RlmN [Candidatus Pelagibacter sp.]|nr:23S rRNA (adenine(2503)-C(2))-methyltransferase RlmN [Candidatus Pelagibacter sp.]|tara:strand:- start:488 stop:1570 length:1083 start_codon:yes stop_codon:yes gene_type:complete
MINFADLNYLDVKKNFSKIFIDLDRKKLSMRTNQIWKFYYQKGYFKPSLFSNLPSEIIKAIENKINFTRLKIKKKQLSKDGTIKWLLELKDKNLVETVYIPSESHGTLCISSQVGCTLNCKFCHTGTQPLVKNLSSNEIINQIMVAKDELNEWFEQKKINNIVYMGMGEPLYNFENVKKSVQILKDTNGLNFSNKRITISTSGISPNIKKAANEIGTYLALSLHAPNNNIRNSLMPINKKFNIKNIIEDCNHYAKENKNKIFIEYVLLKNINDSAKCAKQLSNIMSKFPCKLNLIQFNPWPGVKYTPSTYEQTLKFIEIVQKNGHIVTLRKSRGDDILGACGQLKTASGRAKRFSSFLKN